jgi:hypothetical protein
VKPKQEKDFLRENPDIDDIGGPDGEGLHPSSEPVWDGYQVLLALSRLRQRTHEIQGKLWKHEPAATLI